MIVGSFLPLQKLLQSLRGACTQKHHWVVVDQQRDTTTQLLPPTHAQLCWTCRQTPLPNCSHLPCTYPRACCFFVSFHFSPNSAYLLLPTAGQPGIPVLWDGRHSAVMLHFKQTLEAPLIVIYVRLAASFYLFHGDILQPIIRNELFFPHKMKSMHIRIVRLELHSILMTRLETACDESWLDKSFFY